MAIKTYGLMGVDWEERINYERLRNERLARIKNCSRNPRWVRCCALI